MGSHSVTCHLDTSELTPPNPSQTGGWYSIYLLQRDGRLSWPRNKTSEMELLRPVRTTLAQLHSGCKTVIKGVTHAQETCTSNLPWQYLKGFRSRRFHGLDALAVTQSTASKHWKHLKILWINTTIWLAPFSQKSIHPFIYSRCSNYHNKSYSTTGQLSGN